MYPRSRSSIVSDTATLALTVAVGSALALPSAGIGQQLPAADTPLAPEATELYSIGRIDGDEWENFSRIASVAFDRDGRLYVLDSDRGRVSVVSQDGRQVQEFGRPGEGPGEFGLALALAVLGDGTVAVVDLRNRAFQLFDDEGEYLRSIPVDAVRMQSFGAILPHPSESAFFEGGGQTRAIAFSLDGNVDAPTGRPIYRTDTDRGERELFYEAWRPVPAGGAGDLLQSGGAISLNNLGSLRPAIWEPNLWMGVLPDGGLAVVDSATYEVQLLDPTGRARSTLRRPSIGATPVTDRMIEDEKERQMEAIASGEQSFSISLGGSGSSPLSPQQQEQFAREQVEQLRFHHEIPAVSRMSVAPTGTIWVQRYDEAFSRDGPIDLVRMDGSYVGTLPAGDLGMPSAFGPDGLVAYIGEGEFDIPIVTVMRLGPAIR